MKLEQLGLNRFGYKASQESGTPDSQSLSANNAGAVPNPANNISFPRDNSKNARNVVTGTVITSCFIQTSALPNRVEIADNDVFLYDDSSGGGGSIEGDTATIKFLRADKKPGTVIIQKRKGVNSDDENVFELFYDAAAGGGKKNYIFIGREGDSQVTNFSDLVVLHGTDSVRAEINRIQDYNSRPPFVVFDMFKSNPAAEGVASLLMGEGRDGLSALGFLVEQINFGGATSFAVGDTITGNVSGATALLLYKISSSVFLANHTSYGTKFTAADTACTTNGAGGGSGTGAFSSSSFQNWVSIYTDKSLNAILGTNLIPDTDVAYDIGSSSKKIKDLWVGGTIHGGAGGINGRSSGSGVTTIADVTDTKVTPVNDFANGITWDDTNKRFVVLIAGQYQINAQVTWSQQTDGKQYYTYIFKNGVVASYSLFQGASAAGVASGAVNDILDLAVNDYIELWCRQASGGNQNIYNNSSITFLSISKV